MILSARRATVPPSGGGEPATPVYLLNNVRSRNSGLTRGGAGSTSAMSISLAGRQIDKKRRGQTLET
jgi:hypothetical protein